MSVGVTFSSAPINVPVIDRAGLMSHEWQIWFSELEILLNELVQQINATP